MKKPVNESDFIGGLGSLTKEEETALSQHFTKKKIKNIKSSNFSLAKSKNQIISNILRE